VSGEQRGNALLATGGCVASEAGRHAAQVSSAQDTKSCESRI